MKSKLNSDTLQLQYFTKRLIHHKIDQSTSNKPHERKLQLESAPFYSRERFYDYLRDDSKIVNWILVICDKCEMAPGDAFFRHRRPGYIHEITESGRQGLVSSQNAALMLAKHVGDDYDDKKDAVLMSARWPALADSLSRNWGLNYAVRKVSR